MKLSKENYIPLTSEWTTGSVNHPPTNIRLTGDYSVIYHATNEESYLQARVKNQALAGKKVAFGFSDFRADDGEAWVYARLYTTSNNYTEILNIENYAGGAGQFEIEIPESFYELRLRLRHMWSSSVDTDITVKDAYVKIIEVDPSIQFHKVLIGNVPSSVERGTEHIYYAKDESCIRTFISTKEGNVLEIKPQAIAGDYISSLF